MDEVPQLTILVTSRLKLGFQREIVRLIEGLPVPQTLADTAVPSVQLFVERGERMGVRLETAVLPDVARICQFLGGIPLALELAATWVDQLPVSTIHDAIISNLNMLHSHMRDVPSRHHSMRAVFEVSWNLLGNVERNVLARLSIFQGGFTAEAAAFVAAAMPLL